MSAETPARVAREMKRLDVARTLAKARVCAGIDQQDVADACGVNRSVPARWESSTGDKHITLADAALVPHPVGVALANWLAAEHGCGVAPVQADESITVATLPAVMSEVHDVVQALALGVADGALDAAELERIEREANEAVAQLTKLAMTARQLRLRGVAQGPVRVVFAATK